MIKVTLFYDLLPHIIEFLQVRQVGIKTLTGHIWSPSLVGSWMHQTAVCEVGNGGKMVEREDRHTEWRTVYLNPSAPTEGASLVAPVALRSAALIGASAHSSAERAHVWTVFHHRCSVRSVRCRRCCVVVGGWDGRSRTQQSGKAGWATLCRGGASSIRPTQEPLCGFLWWRPDIFYPPRPLIRVSVERTSGFLPLPFLPFFLLSHSLTNAKLHFRI